jgi:RimJ/RimL family protein N-acetyltransferase
MMILTAPAGPLTDGVVVLRLPSPDAGDVATVNGYIRDEQLDGGWLPEVPLITGQQLVADWLDGWAGRHSRNGPAFVVTVPDEQRLVGVVGMLERDDGVIEISYGTAPGWRGKGLASRATRLATQWVARQPGVRTVEARMDHGEPASERVAVNAGFVLAETLHQSDPDNPDTAVELRYILARPEVPESRSDD